MDSRLEKKIQDALALWQRIWGDSVKSAYLYGSAARGDHDSRSSDINLLLVLDSGDTSRWPDAADTIKRKARKGFATPLVLSENYIHSSLDVYPMEFLDMKLFHRTLVGEDIFDSVTLQVPDLRLHAEREVKGKWVQLRQAALESGGNTPAMRGLLSMSASTWAAVFQTILHIHGEEVPADREAVIRAGSSLAGVDAEVFVKLWQVRRGTTSPGRMGAWELLQSTLHQVDILARYVDSWEL